MTGKSRDFSRNSQNYVTDLRGGRRVTSMDERGQRKLASIGEAAAVVGRHPKTIRRYIDAGKLDVYRVGVKFVRVDLDQVEEVFGPQLIKRAS